MEKAISAFVKTYCRPGETYLLALSGGPDSLALYSLLKGYAAVHPFVFSVCHIDHRWRPESADQASCLQALVEKDGRHFYLKTLDPLILSGNQENACREQRLEYYQALCREFGFAGVFLGHHGDDQAETVLKRLLEGAPFHRLGAMTPVSKYQEIPLYRPLLEFSKEEILTYINQKGLIPFDDATNRDERYLRAKMRESVIPYLSKAIGKEVRGNLLNFAKESTEITHYFDEAIAPYLGRIKKGPLGYFLDLQDEPPIPKPLCAYFIRQFCANAALSLSREQVQFAVESLRNNTSNKQIDFADWTLYFDRGSLFLVPRTGTPRPNLPLPISKEKVKWGEWVVELFDGKENTIQTTWRSMWEDPAVFFVDLPEGEFSLSYPTGQIRYPGQASIGRWWNRHQAPSWIGRRIPVIINRNGEVVHEFLSGKKTFLVDSNVRTLRLKWDH